MDKNVYCRSMKSDILGIDGLLQCCCGSSNRFSASIKCGNLLVR
jgi:hypothetical protein